MSRYLLPASILALAGAIVFWSLPNAVAGPDDPVRCYPTEQVLTSAGTDATKVAASAQVLMKRQLGEGRGNMVQIAIAGTDTLCFWK